MKSTYIPAAALTVVSLIASGCAAGSGDGDSTTLTVSSAISAEHPLVAQFLNPLFERVEAETDGALKFEHYPGGQLGSAADAVSHLSTGVADISYMAFANDPGAHPYITTMFGMPGLFPDSVSGSSALREHLYESPILTEDFERHGIYPLVAMPAAPYDLWTTGAEIKSPEDLRGKRIRTSGGAQAAYLGHEGATEVQMPAEETFGLLDSGGVDAVQLDATYVNVFGLTPLVTWATSGAGLGSAVWGYSISQDVWDSLAPEHRELLGEEMTKLTEEYAVFQDEDNERIRTGAETEHVEYFEVEGDDLAAWQRSYDEFNSEWVDAQSLPGFRELYDSYRQTVAQMGS